MAYVIWRVLMKKYSRVRLGLHKAPFQSVTPTGRHVLTYDQESWTPAADDQTPSKSKETDEISRSSETRQSKTKRVKNYLKKCKNALARSNSEQSTSGGGEVSNSSWYIDKQLEEFINESEIHELDNVFERVQESPSVKTDFSDKLQIANVIDNKALDETRSENGAKIVGVFEANLAEFSPLLIDTQETVEEPVDENCAPKAEDNVLESKGDVANLVERLFGPLYENFKNSKKSLVRQARDLLVCEYHGCLQRFEDEFCIPAAKLLGHVKREYASTGNAPSGWPLCLGPCGIVVHLGPLSPTFVRNRDCYLCVRNRSLPGLELALVWRKSSEINCQTIAQFKDPQQNLDEIMCSTLKSIMDLEFNASVDETDGTELPELLQNLLVSVEHAIERVPLDDLTFPCPQCLQYLPLDRQEEVDETSCSCQCSCRMPENIVAKKDTSIQTSPMFEFVGSIPHIDSDEDDEESVKSGTSCRKSQELTAPKRITDLPEKLLMSGINLPGTTDSNGKPIVLCYAECIARAGLNKYEIAKLLLYYASITSSESLQKGFTILLLAESDEETSLEVLDKAAALLVNYLKVSSFIIWRPGGKNGSRVLSTSRIQARVITDEVALEDHIARDQAPASCGGSCNHDQLEWVEFYKQLEPFLESCRSAGRALLSVLSHIRNEEVPGQVTRRFLNHQFRQITKALQLESVQELRRDGPAILASLEERTQWLSSSKDVRRNARFSNESFHSVDRVQRRLEQLAAERKERLRELQRLRTLQDEIEELLAWIRKVGDETLLSRNILLRTASDVSSVKDIEKDFEKFYFDAMRQIDKAGDLIEEANNIPEERGKALKESANNLKTQTKSFSEKLEDARERLEECSRCFQLIENCKNNLSDDDAENFKRLAQKSGNEKLMELYKVLMLDQQTAQPPDRDKVLDEDYDLIATSTPLKLPPVQLRRRSVSSLAFIYKCNHHAAGVSCNCCESDTENTVSNKLKKKYLQTLQNCGCNSSVSCKETLDRKNSLTLGGIKEVRESVENLLENDDKNELDLSGCGRCDSGVSTAENSVGDDSNVYKKKLQRTCSCQYYRESCNLCSAASSSTGSNQDHTENQQDSITEEGSDGFAKSGSDDIEEETYNEERRVVPPIAANSHLHCHGSTLNLSGDAFDGDTDLKTQKTLLFIMREMIQTERDYVKSLEYVRENYIPEVNREDIPQALRGQRNVVFGNIEKIHEFHGQYFLRELEQCENDPLHIGQIFLKHDKKFYLYALYNKNKPKSDTLMSEYGTTFFKDKQIQLGDKMDLASYLLKPVQRMGKYALLLQQLMKACPLLPSGASERAISEQDDLKQAEQMVRFQLRHGNDLLAMDSIRECDVNLKEQGRLLRQNEFLVWEGRTGKKSLRQVFLFEDMILFSKARRFPDRKNLDLFIYKSSIKMTDIGLTAKIGESPTKFEIWFRKRKPNDTFTLQSMSEEIKKAWSEELSQLLWKQAIKNREVRMAEMSSMGIGNKPCLDIRPSADQISDRSISVAQLSKTAPRFRNSFVGTMTELYRTTKRPHSVISMSSVSASSTSSGGSSGGTATSPAGLMSLSFDNSCDSPKPYHRSATLNSQCSMESGIIADISLGNEECPESIAQQNMHWPLEKSNSQHSHSSSKSNVTTPTQSDDTQITNYRVPDEIPYNI